MKTLSSKILSANLLAVLLLLALYIFTSILPVNPTDTSMISVLIKTVETGSIYVSAILIIILPFSLIYQIITTLSKQEKKLK
ncbi:MAG: hypothetical protein WCP97_04495 [bacterium]